MQIETYAHILSIELTIIVALIFVTVLFIIMPYVYDFIIYKIALYRRNKHRIKCGLPKLKHL